jgi:hypothetical protein
LLFDSDEVIVVGLGAEGCWIGDRLFGDRAHAWLGRFVRWHVAVVTNGNHWTSNLRPERACRAVQAILRPTKGGYGSGIRTRAPFFFAAGLAPDGVNTP